MSVSIFSSWRYPPHTALLTIVAQCSPRENDVLLIFPSDIHYHPGSNLNLSCHAASHPLAH
ncbi:carcinoembryonic antigen-related cell adhesion molecule 2-like [Mus caroli]|uniref:Carcinoembryonic antigen-related cell adhesion molecule 2-like n=1 Tax=Mus caroli TaxID=10089 RepID=A0A6P5P7E4_MUSCR|nr:carcinoembryonic antigen-related cell adhesion molecule 2-like [Mus caroli]